MISHLQQPQRHVLGVAGQRAHHHFDQRRGLDERRGGGQRTQPQPVGALRGQRLHHGLGRRVVMVIQRGRGRRRPGRPRLQVHQQRLQQRRHVGQVAAQGERVAARLQRVAGQAGRGRKVRGPAHPAAGFRRIDHAHQRRVEEGVAPVRAGVAGGVAAEFGITLAQQPEGVFVEAQPDMQPMLLDAPRRPAARGPLAAHAPAGLVDRDLVAAAMFGPRQLEGRGHRGAAAADHGHPDGAVAVHAAASVAGLAIADGTGARRAPAASTA